LIEGSKAAGEALENCRLLIVRPDRRSKTEVLALRAKLLEADLSIRICLALDSSCLKSIAGAWESDDRIGLLLDEVDSQTSFSDIACESIEAIRLSARFAIEAGNQLRSNCILEAILGLAHQIGLCTLGPSTRSAECENQFDYVLDPNAHHHAHRPTGSSRAKASAPQVNR